MLPITFSGGQRSIPKSPLPVLPRELYAILCANGTVASCVAPMHPQPPCCCEEWGCAVVDSWHPWSSHPQIGGAIRRFREKKAQNWPSPGFDYFPTGNSKMFLKISRTCMDIGKSYFDKFLLLGS